MSSSISIMLQTLRRIVSLQFCCLCLSGLAMLSGAGRALAVQVAYYFEGRNNLAAIDDVPVGNFDRFIGSLSYNTDAQLISGTTSSASYFDPNGSLTIAYDQVAFLATGGLNIRLSRIDIPFVQLSTLTFGSSSVFAWGTSEPIAGMNLSFTGPVSGLDGVALPETINAVLSGQISITSPDLINTFPEPPRDDLIAGTLDQRVKLPTPAVPEPATAALTALGLLALGAMHRRFARTFPTTHGASTMRRTRCASMPCDALKNELKG